ncbi:hypothetical protein CHELA41_22201 [Hyphomicrobiales bacterium]|nr:hypothetical protein CHELA41_22201 [Hyphomicrobiales bacterium]
MQDLQQDLRVEEHRGNSIGGPTRREVEHEAWTLPPARLAPSYTRPISSAGGCEDKSAMRQIVMLNPSTRML